MWSCLLCGLVHDNKYLVIFAAVRTDAKELREASSAKVKATKHKLADTSSDGERTNKESRHESHDRGRGAKTDVKRSDIDARQKERSCRTDVDRDGSGDSDRAQRGEGDRGQHDQLSSDELMSGNRPGDGQRRSAQTPDKAADDRGQCSLALAPETNYVLYTMC